MVFTTAAGLVLRWWLFLVLLLMESIFRCGISIYFHAENLTKAPFRVYEAADICARRLVRLTSGTPEARFCRPFGAGIFDTLTWG